MTTNKNKAVTAYLERLTAALRGEDPAMIHDALADAEEHLRAEVADLETGDDGTLLEGLIEGYGTPEEVADGYRATERTVARALGWTPNAAAVDTRPWPARFFGVLKDPDAYAALF